MSKKWQTVMKPAFVDYLPKLTGKEVVQVMEKVTMLTIDPRPDSKVKKQLTHLAGRPYRIRSGKYRIFYTFSDEVVSIYKIDNRDDDTYNDAAAPEAPPQSDVLAGLELSQGDAQNTTSPQPDWEKIFNSTPPAKPLPEPLTVELLKLLHVPVAYHTRLLRIKDQDQLLACPGIPDEVLLKLDTYLFERPLEQIMQQPDLVLGPVDDLLRYKEGELLAFLLHLSPEQEKYAHWSLQVSGPTLVKGGPGTGKSTVALYRIRSLLEQLLKTNKTPRILFTTYTNALIKSSEQLLQQLLGSNTQYVRVDTVDKLARDILQQTKQVKEILEQKEQLKLLKQALIETLAEGNALQQLAQKLTFERMGLDYILQEINTVIIARQISSLGEYQQTARTGRKVRLSANQRASLWKVYERFGTLLQASGKESWQQRRARAERLTEKSQIYQHYDAVVIDEAQDLDPSALRLLIKLSKTPQRIFITADANQSIYGSGFTWSDVHSSLKFQGRTSILRANYRSTQEIGEAAQSYLSHGALESEENERQYIHSGPMPDARSVQNSSDEAQLLASYFQKAARSFRLTIGSCAVLCPNEHAGNSIANSLNELGLEATFMGSSELNLTRSGIKILTLHASKGLEFPIVALAGFNGSSYPFIPHTASEDERQEILARERRTMFVGMTRAMRALLVVTPSNPDSPLLEGFDPTQWNFTRKI